jgi:hypothetical protein
MINRLTGGAPCLGLILAFGCACALAQDHLIERGDVGREQVTLGAVAGVGLLPTLPADATSSPKSIQPSAGLLHRISRFYLTDWGGAPSVSAPAVRRGLDAPMDSPPFPSSDWAYGGSPTIGVPDANVYPAMSAIQQEGRRTRLYGWVQASGNASTSSSTNYPITYGFVPNRVVLNQAVLALERQPDTTQASRFDWGFHLSGLFGTDYRYTTSKGYLSGQLLTDNNQYGFDPLWESLDLYFPVKEGLVVRLGRFLAMPGIETQLAPSNYALTHSLVYSAAPSTETGAMASLKLTRQWIVQVGISAGHDVAPWTVDRKASLIACVDYSTTTNYNNLYLCASGINDGRYAYNNVQHYDATWNHRFNAKWNTETEAWVMYERDVPNVAQNVLSPIPTETGANGAFCGAGQVACMAPAYAAMNYLSHTISSKLFVGMRNGFLNDKKGQRTGIPGKYTENTLYATKTFGTTVMLRSELRFDHSWDNLGYNAGKARNQLFFAMDLIYKF